MTRPRPDAPPLLIIPMETKVRELHSKLLTACCAVEQGFTVVIGGSVDIRDRAAEWPQGFFLDKSVAPSRGPLFHYYRTLGHRIVAWCEEGLTLNDPEEYVRRKINARAVEQTEAFFAWGDYQAGLVRGAVPGCDSRLHLTGNPRLDLLRTELRALQNDAVAARRKEYGPFVLINTNFSLCNHRRGEGAFIAMQKQAGKVRTPEHEAFALGWVAHKKNIFDAFMAMVPELRKACPGHRIVIRPHPSENHETWRKLAASLPGVSVVYEGNVAEWILAADFLVHNGCTTGIEAYLLDRPVVAYQPVVSDVHDAQLPNQLSRRVFSLSELIGACRGILAGESEPETVLAERRQYAVKYMSGLDGAMAADRIASVLRELASSPRPPVPLMPTWRVVATRSFAGLRQAYRARTSGPRRPSDYERQKFPGLEDGELSSALGALRAVTGRFNRLRQESLGRTCYRLTQGT